MDRLASTCLQTFISAAIWVDAGIRFDLFGLTCIKQTTMRLAEALPLPVRYYIGTVSVTKHK